MKNIYLLNNTVQTYAWGSHTAIPELLGKKTPSKKPQAELWMGAHPKAPSMINMDGKRVSLEDAIHNAPDDILGKTAAKKFNGKLPFLFKVLAVAQPLSLQAHPDKTRAVKGFKRENKAGMDLHAPERNYRDDNHKPECLCALTPFIALSGFRKVTDILSDLNTIKSKELLPLIRDLNSHPASSGLKKFFKRIITAEGKYKQEIIKTTITHAGRLSGNNPAFEWMTKLHQAYPDDMGIFAPLFLNLICLKPGQALFLPAGELHSYLEGTGVEIMANSDNVLRGGLTSKHVDVPELLTVLRFKKKTVRVIEPVSVSDHEQAYTCPAGEFALSVISTKKGTAYTAGQKRNIEIILCVQGKALLIQGENKLSLKKGASAVIPASVKHYAIEGDAVMYKASVPT